jgi:hypothetical protein
MNGHLTKSIIALFAVSVWCSSLTAQSEELTAKTPAVGNTALFNGRDLSGWRAEGAARWSVQDGVLVGQQGAKREAGDLLTEQEFDNFDLTVVFRVEWPANTGVWYRYRSADQAFQADILEYKNPVAWTGTLYCTGKMFLAINKDPKLVRRDDWNTMRIRAHGNHHQIWLNGTEVADVKDDTSDRGRIGFQIHAGDEFEKMKLYVKEVTLRPIPAN